MTLSQNGPWQTIEGHATMRALVVAPCIVMMSSINVAKVFLCIHCNVRKIPSNVSWEVPRIKASRLGITSGSPDGDDPGRNNGNSLATSRFSDAFDTFQRFLRENAGDLLPHAIRDRTAQRQSGGGPGRGGGWKPLQVVTIHMKIHLAVLSEISTEATLKGTADFCELVSRYDQENSYVVRRDSVYRAKVRHKDFVLTTPELQMAMEQRYVLGRASVIPRPEHTLEGLARCEVLEILPRWLKDKIDIAGVHTMFDIVWYVLKVLQPSQDFLRSGIAKDVLRRQPGLDMYEKAFWLQAFHTKLVVAIDADSRVEPQEVHRLLVDAMQNVCHDDITATLAWHSRQ
eukprot:6489021-Amphidinium_carterae.1